MENRKKALLTWNHTVWSMADDPLQKQEPEELRENQCETDRLVSHTCRLFLSLFATFVRNMFLGRSGCLNAHSNNSRGAAAAPFVQAISLPVGWKSLEGTSVKYESKTAVASWTFKKTPGPL